MTPARSITEMSPDVAAIIAADLRYFRRHPHREYRLRLAGQCEIEEARRFLGLTLPPSGVRIYCAQRRLGPGYMHGTIGFAHDTREVDFDEHIARAAYRILGPQDITRRPNPDDLWCPPGPFAFDSWRLGE